MKPAFTLAGLKTSLLMLRTPLLFAALAVASFHLAYARVGCELAIVIFLYCLLRLANLPTPRQAFYFGLAVGLASYAPHLRFFWTLFQAAAIPLWCVLAFWVGLFVVLARASLLRFGPVVGPCMAPFIWMGLEYFRSELYFLRFSWLTPGFAFSDSPRLSQLSGLGVYGIGFLAMSIAVLAILLPRIPRPGKVALGAACGLILFWPAPKDSHARPPAKLLNVAGVQLEFPGAAEVVLALNRAIQRFPQAELLVLSEYTFDGPVPEIVRKWCRAHHKHLIAGGKEELPRQRNGGSPERNFYNTAFVIDPEGEVIFRQVKTRPIQFFKDGLPAPSQGVWDSPWGKLGLAICYDASYSRVIDELVRQGAQALIIPTMDVSDWGEYQHQLHARVILFRAAEYGLPVFRVCSSGISQLADSRGNCLATAPFPGEGSILGGTLLLSEKGSLPLDRRLAILSVVLTAVLIAYLILPHCRRRKEAPAKENEPAGRSPVIVRVLQNTLRALFRLFFGFRASNEEVLAAPGPVMLLPNHVSWFDWLFIAVCIDTSWKFVTSMQTARISWLHRFIMINRFTFPVETDSPYAVKRMAEYLQAGGKLVLFPEGRLSRTGSLMKIFDGTGFLLFKTQAKVFSCYIRGAQHLPFSPNPNPKSLFSRVSVHFSDILAPPLQTGVSTTRARHKLTRWLWATMIAQQFEVELAAAPKTVLHAIVATARKRPGRVVLEDVTYARLNYRRLLAGIHWMSGELRGLLSGGEERVGVLLANTNAMPIALLSLWSIGKIPAILNYSTGSATMLACAQLAGLRTVITSRTFLQRAKLNIQPMVDAGIKFVYLEDMRARLTSWRRLRALARIFFNPGSAIRNSVCPDTAVILFTSGSEGPPKGVELTHHNLLSNIEQMLSSVDLTDSDRLCNALPLFHSFGLAVGLLLPLVRGNFVFLYPSPLHYRIVPNLFYNLDCTVFFGTNTFLAGYARKAHPFDFRSLRYLFAGAEKLQESTANIWARRFGVRVLEGYGATECSPCLCANTLIDVRFGSVGRFLPGIDYKIEPVSGVAEGGRLWVRGPNIMKGYLNADANQTFQAQGGWYDTGDIARVDDDGFVYLLGRLKRFAKVSGEMVSLTAVEEALSGAFPQYGLHLQIAILSRPDAGKGEALVAVANDPKLTLEEIRAVLKARGFSNLCAPRELKYAREIPKLGTGKVNHRELQTTVFGAP